MRINPEFILRNIAGDRVVVPTGSASQRFNGLITMNEVATFIWNHVSEIESEEDMVKLVLEEYEVEEALARKDVHGFMNMLREQGILLDD